MRLVILSALIFVVAGCGNLKRAASGITGEPSEYCYQGVTYLQFPSGATVAVDQSGKPLSCR